MENSVENELEKFSVEERASIEKQTEHFFKARELTISNAPIEMRMYELAEAARISLERGTKEKIEFNPYGIDAACWQLNCVRNSPNLQMQEKVIHILQTGAFVGQIYYEQYGARWIDDGMIFGYGMVTYPVGVVIFPNGLCLNPFLRVGRHIDKGESSDLLKYHQGIMQLLRTGVLSDGITMDIGEAWFNSEDINKIFSSQEGESTNEDQLS